MDIDEILKYEKLVYSVIGKYKAYFAKDDLYQAGMMALVKAYKNYNKEKSSAKFSTYAYFYILGEINEQIRGDKNLKISKDIIKLNKRIEITKDFLSQKLGRMPTSVEISLYLDIDLELIEEVQMLTSSVESLDIESDYNTNMYNSIKTYDKETSSEVLDLNSELDKLPDLEKKIIYDRYYMGYTQTEISENLGLTQVQVSRKEKKVLEKLKSRL